MRRTFPAAALAAVGFASTLAVSSAALGEWGLGTNLGNTLDAPTEGAWAPAAQEYFFDDFKAAGFQFVRIPVRWDEHTGTAPPYTIDASFLERVQQVTNWTISRGMRAIVNSHHDDWLDTADDAAFAAALPRFTAIWTQVSHAFQGWDNELLSFECFNEPHLMSTASLNTMYKAFAATVRPLHPTRLLMYGPWAYDAIWWTLANPHAMVLPTLPNGQADPNIVVHVHDYDPFKFTSPPITITSWGNSSDVAQLYQRFANITAWGATVARASSGADGPPVPILLGEFACSHLQNNTAARLAWYTAYTGAARAAGFLGASIWDDDGWYVTYNRTARTWDKPVLTAIGL